MTSRKNIATFDGAPPPGTINFAIGQPSADLLPLNLLQQASQAFFEDAENVELNYGVLQGDVRFLQSLAGFLSQEYSAPTDPESLLVTAGNSQALDMVCTTFASAGDTVFVEEPSYFLAFQILRDHGLNIISIPMDDDGLDVDYLEEQLDNYRPAFLYTIPAFHNPGGQTLSQTRRDRLLKLSQQHEFLIVADEVYHLLSYDGAPPAAFGTRVSTDTVLSLGSFSKILAPALRLGWIQTSPHLMQRLLSGGVVNSGGSINHFTSHIVRKAIDDGLQSVHVDSLRMHYRERRNAMQTALVDQFSDIADWSQPSGGYFFWLRLRHEIDTSHYRSDAGDNETGFQSGCFFSNCNALKSCLRLCFAHYMPDDIAEGITRLRRVFD